MKTVLDVIQATTGYFQKSGVESARLNIEHLLAHVLGKRRMDLYLEFDRPLSEAELEPLRGLVKRRAAGEPLQHLLGTAEFYGRVFTCDARALVPRPETEQLVELLLADKPAPARVLDVGTGSGVIALTLAAEWPEAEVEAVDLSEAALSLARENAERLGLAARVQIRASDLLAAVAGEFQLIVANLPYVSTTELAGLSREVHCDPASALDGGAGGMELIERLIAAAPTHLRGKLALEIGHDQAQAVRSKLAEHNFQDIRVLPDYQGRLRFALAHYG
ncbi:MAG: Release factor glutamine methyltransferase [Chthoniobacter sp.]|nr:Release factor glutamine methyltransferase [Chthoniobacter sp.]